jgi:hypothetical protein
LGLGALSQERRSSSNYADVLRLFALFAGSSVELNSLSLFETLVAISLDIGEMDEDVITLLARNKAEALVCVKKLHYTLCHEFSILKAKDRPFPSSR